MSLEQNIKRTLTRQNTKKNRTRKIVPKIKEVKPYNNPNITMYADGSFSATVTDLKNKEIVSYFSKVEVKIDGESASAEKLTIEKKNETLEILAQEKPFYVTKTTNEKKEIITQQALLRSYASTFNKYTKKLNIKTLQNKLYGTK